MQGMNKLIVFEGIDGAGKATQVELLAKKLRRDGKRVTVFVSPRYETPTGKIVKQALSGAYGDFVGLSPHLSALPYLLDFAASRDEIRDALKKGVVICDRYVPSTVAYHSAKLSGKAAKDFIKCIEKIAFEKIRMPVPTCVVYLKVPVNQAQKQMAGKKKDQHEKDLPYQNRVANVYALLRKRKGWSTVDCFGAGTMRSPREIHTEIAALIG